MLEISWHCSSSHFVYNFCNTHGFPWCWLQDFQVDFPCWGPQVFVREQILVNKSDKSDHPHQWEPWCFVEVVNKSEHERKTSSPQHSRCSYASGELIRINFHPKTAEKMAPHCMARLDLVNCRRFSLGSQWNILKMQWNNPYIYEKLYFEKNGQFRNVRVEYGFGAVCESTTQL